MSLPENLQNNFLPEEIQFLVENELIKIIPAMDGKPRSSKHQHMSSKQLRREKLLAIRAKERERRQAEIYSDDENPYETLERSEDTTETRKYGGVGDDAYLDIEKSQNDTPEDGNDSESFDWSFITTDQQVLRNLKSSIPIEIPLWMAMILKKQRFCRLIAPSWLSVKKLKDYLKFERNNPYKFSTLPWSWMVISKIFINQFADDLPKEDKVSELRSVLQDIREIRLAKVQRGMEILNESHLQLDNLSLLEINEFRPFILTTMTKMKNLHKSSLTQEDLQDKVEEEPHTFETDDRVPMDVDDYDYSV